MLTVPVIDARIIPAHQVDVGNANLYLVRLDIYPARRQAEFNKVTVENCRLMKFAQRRTQRGETLYIPDYEKGVFNDFSFPIVVPPEARQTTPISLMFFIAFLYAVFRSVSVRMGLPLTERMMSSLRRFA